MQRQVPEHGLRLSRGSSCASPRRLFGRFSSPGLLALFALGHMAHYSFVTLYLAVFTSCLGVAVVYGTWILREMTLALGSTMDTCSASELVFCMKLHIFSTLPRTRILKWLVFVLSQNGQECSADASVSVLATLLAPGNLEILSRVPRGWR